jgi:hypothetical protein
MAPLDTTVLQKHSPLILRRLPRREAKANPDVGKSKHRENRPFIDSTQGSVGFCDTVVLVDYVN